ncbi:histidine kinase [Streptomyces sp. SID5475]|nr:histidine kinase [Streptomyces sp. SID5475]
MFGPRGRWGKRSRIAQVDLYTRGSLYVMIWLIPPYMLFMLAATASKGLGGAVENGAAVLLALLAPAQAVSAVRLLRRGIDQYRGRSAVPRRETVAGAALMTAALVPVAVLAAGEALGDEGLPVLLASLTVIPFLAPYALLAPLRTVVLVEAGWLAAVLAGFAVAGVDRPLLAGTALGLVFSCAWSVFTVRCSVWMLAVMYELEESRTVQARLAVAEERLRFARDMHDVMGRNLAVIALKSELAAQLTRRGSAAAVDQMVEVQRIAQESQREVREVVRGYREADLHTELVGAGAVLRSAGIDCRIDDRHPGGLSPAARSALGWVVREGTTNVLRHAEARSCAIRVRPGRAPDGGRTTVLVMENDGVPDGGPGGPPRPDGGHPDTSAGANGGAGSGLALVE